MKNILIFVICLTSLAVSGQDVEAAFDGKNWPPPYTLATPAGWDVERFLIPIGFAPQIPYKGVEDIRFTPGWAKVTTDDYWSYTFLWYLDSLPQMGEQVIQTNLQAYYTGLVEINKGAYKIPEEKIFPAKAIIKKTKTTKGDHETYSGTIEMLDYMEQKPLILNCLIHVRPYKEKGKTVIFHELSPKAFSHKIWLSLNKLWADFEYK
ncbi:MAG: hypothetical protein ABIN67_01085 [Ferruginibacter sp.]